MICLIWFKRLWFASFGFNDYGLPHWLLKGCEKADVDVLGSTVPNCPYCLCGCKATLTQKFKRLQLLNLVSMKEMSFESFVQTPLPIPHLHTHTSSYHTPSPSPSLWIRQPMGTHFSAAWWPCWPWGSVRGRGPGCAADRSHSARREKGGQNM